MKRLLPCSNMGQTAAPPKCEVQRHGALGHSNDGMAGPLGGYAASHFTGAALRSESLLFFRMYLLVVQEVPARGACVRGSYDKPLKKASVEGVDFIGVMKVSLSRRIKYAESFSIPGSP